MNCSPLRGVRVEPLLPSLPSSPLRMQPLPMCDLDTSLDDEFAMQQRQQTVDDMDSHSNESLAQPTLRELADEALPSSHEPSDCEGGDEELEEECSRSAFSLPMPTPTPMRAAPSPHAPHSHAFLHAHTLAAHSSPAIAAPQLVTPPTRVAAQRHATPTGDAAAAPLVDYRGTPIDTAPRRNLLERQGDNAVDWNAFRAAAAASLSHTAQHTVLHTLASPSKSVHLHRLEAQMAALGASPLRPHHEYDADAYADGDQCVAVALSHADAESSVLQVEESAVELASDAVEEIGKHDDDDDGDDGGADDELDASACVLQRWGTSPRYYRNQEERHSYDEFITAKSSFGYSPAASDTVASPFATPAVPLHETRSVQKIRSSSPAAATPLNTTRRIATPSSINLSASGPLPAPDSQPWSTPMELSKAASKQWLQHSRYNQQVALAKQKKHASLLASAALPKITPPTLDQWQREVDAKRPGSATPMLRPNMRSSLTLIKSKAASKRTASTAKSAAAATTESTTAARTRPTSGPRASSSLLTLSRAPLAPLPLNSVVANPWSSAEQQAADAAQPFHTPLKRTSAPVHHTPATAQTPHTAEEERSPQPPPPPALHQLSPSLAPPAQPAQTYRAVVDGLHVIPPALSWVAAHQIQPDRIHQNLRFITTAFAHAD